MVPFTPPYAALWSLQDLCEYLREEEVVHRADLLASVVEIPTTLDGHAMLIRWEWHRPLVQLIQVVAAAIPGDRLALVDQALARLNHAAPITGFALDVERRFAYFRLTLERDEHHCITVGQFNRALRSTLAAARGAVPVIAALTTAAAVDRAA